MTKSQVKEYIIDKIISIVMSASSINENGYFDNQIWNLDFDKIRKTITESGKITDSIYANVISNVILLDGVETVSNKVKFSRD